MRLVHETKKDIEADIKVAKKIWLPWWAVLCLIVGGLPIAWLFDHFGKFDLARPSLLSAGTIALAIAIKWKLGRNPWFWITMAVIVALHLVLILSVSWTTKWVPASVSAGVCTVDFFVMLAIIDVVETFLKGREKAKQKLSQGT